VTLLSSTYSLLDIRDVESFTGRIVERSGLRLSVEDREELHVYLIEECWLLSTRFQPSRVTFSTFAANTLRLRVVDWQRQRFGRRTWRFKNSVYERPRVELVSLDGSEHDRLDSTLGGSSLDGDASGFAADMRALDTRARRPGRRDDWLGDEAA